MVNIAIVGGNGFIGRNLADFLINKNYSITIISRNVPKIENQILGVVYIAQDANDTETLIEICRSASVIIWLASNIVPAIHGTTLTEDFLSNVNPLVLFLEKAARFDMKTRKLIYLSSGGTIYGDDITFEPIVESTLLQPISEYGLSKLISEEYIRFITFGKNIESYILRPSNVYGKYQNLSKPQGIVGFAFLAAMHNTELVLYNDGKAIRDFIFVDDLSEAIEKIIEADFVQGRITTLNIGSSVPVSILELVKKIEFITGKSIKTISKESRSFDCAYNVLDTKRIRSVLGWRPKTDINTGLNLVWNWLSNRQND